MVRFILLSIVTFLWTACNPSFSKLEECYNNTDCQIGFTCSRAENICLPASIGQTDTGSKPDLDASTEDSNTPEADSGIVSSDASNLEDIGQVTDTSIDDLGQADAADADTTDLGTIDVSSNDLGIELDGSIELDDTGIKPDSGLVDSGIVLLDAAILDAGSADTGAPSCADGVQNGEEAGIDCGGVCPSCTTTIRAASTLMGCSIIDTRCEDDELPPHPIVITTDFEIDQNEVTVEAYQTCVESGVCRRPLSYARDTRCNWDSPRSIKQPINCVFYAEASRYCEYVGKRLPTEAEWERAARGSEGDVYPWGFDTPNKILAVYNTVSNGLTKPVRLTRAAGHGLYDMAGNVWEWVEDCYLANLYFLRIDTLVVNPLYLPSFCQAGRVLRGGSAFDDARFLRASERHYRIETDINVDPYWSYGFRCAKTVDTVVTPVEPIPDEPIPTLSAGQNRP